MMNDRNGSAPTFKKIIYGPKDTGKLMLARVDVFDISRSYAINGRCLPFVVIVLNPGLHLRRVVIRIFTPVGCVFDSAIDAPVHRHAKWSESLTQEALDADTEKLHPVRDCRIAKELGTGISYPSSVESFSEHVCPFLTRIQRLAAVTGGGRVPTTQGSTQLMTFLEMLNL